MTKEEAKQYKGRKVLVRNSSADVWKVDVLERYIEKEELQPFLMESGFKYRLCEPLEGNEAHVGTDWYICDDDWRPKVGETYWTPEFKVEDKRFITCPKTWRGTEEDYALYCAHMAFSDDDVWDCYNLECRLNELIRNTHNLGNWREPNDYTYYT